mmetsp:Transcript_26481/g.47810  ORF Transcript_26481/g.47810 Transcript_26481/m.47810 type:complete len:258 (+) Transcript_26481:77-850(+)
MAERVNELPPEADALITQPEDIEETRVQTWRFKKLAMAAMVITAVAVLTATCFMGMRGQQPEEADVIVLPEAVQQDPIMQEYSSARCILCYPNQCTLDYTGNGAWTNCPATHPYFSESACGCVSSASGCGATLTKTCSLCQDCHSKACNIHGKSMVCGASTPYYEPTSGLCASSCVPPPGPAPPPYSDSSSRRRRRRKSETESSSSSSCKSDSGGTCQFLNCKASRGQTTCSGWSGGYKCLCNKGYCAKNGACVADR